MRRLRSPKLLHFKKQFPQIAEQVSKIRHPIRIWFLRAGIKRVAPLSAPSGVQATIAHLPSEALMHGTPISRNSPNLISSSQMREDSFWNIAKKKKRRKERKETAADNSARCYCRIYRHTLPFMCHVKMRGRPTESSLFEQLANTLWNERRCAATEPNTSQHQQLGRESVFGTDLLSEPRWPFLRKT